MDNIPEVAPKKVFGFAPNVFWLGLVSFFNDFSNEMVKAVLPVFLTVTLGASAAFVGFLDGAADAMASFLRIFSGWLSDRINRRKKIVFWGYALSVLTRWLLVVVSSLGVVFALRVVDRLGKGLRDSPRDALITESVAKEELGKSFGFHRFMDALGGVAGPIAALITLSIVVQDYRKFFLVSGILGLFAIFSLLFIKDMRHPGAAAPKRRKFSLTPMAFSPKFRYFLLSVFVFSLGFLPISLILLRAQSLNLADSFIPILYLIYALSYSFFAIPFGRLADRVSKKSVISAGFLVAIIAYVVLAFAASSVALIIALLLIGIYSALTDGVQRALAGTMLLENQIASGHGYLQATIGIGSLLAGTLGGLAWTRLSPSIALLSAAALMLAGFVLLMFLPVVPPEAGKENPVGEAKV